MTDLKQAVLEARYADMIALGDFIVRDCALPETDSNGNLMPQASEIAASLFRWAAEIPLDELVVAGRSEANHIDLPTEAGDEFDDEYDEGFEDDDTTGDANVDVAEAEKTEAAQNPVQDIAEATFEVMSDTTKAPEGAE